MAGREAGNTRPWVRGLICSPALPWAPFVTLQGLFFSYLDLTPRVNSERGLQEMVICREVLKADPVETWIQKWRWKKNTYVDYCSMWLCWPALWALLQGVAIFRTSSLLLKDVIWAQTSSDKLGSLVFSTILGEFSIRSCSKPICSYFPRGISLFSALCFFHVCFHKHHFT